MLARLRKTKEEGEGGFTLIELLVVMIIIGILAAIAIPVFLSQKKKAGDTSAKADVTTLGKNVAAYYVDGTTALTFTQAGGAGTAISFTDGTYTDSSNTSAGNTLSAKSNTTAAGAWCVAVKNATSGLTWKYTSATGLSAGDCAGSAGA